MGNFHHHSFSVLVLLCFFVATKRSLAKLTAVDPVAVGHKREIKGAPGGRPRELQTLSVDPPVFLVPELLSDSEIDELLAIAQPNKTSKWETSQVGGGAPELQDILRRGGKKARAQLKHIDHDGNGRFDEAETAFIAREFFNMPNFGPDHHAALMAFVYPNEKKMNQNGMTLKAFLKADIFAFFAKLGNDEPHLADRYSHQRWLRYESPVLRTLRDRAEAISGLPRDVIDRSEELQVVHYPVRGHYACHHDSSPDSLDAGDIRLATLGVFLNEPAQGGELAFPAALRGSETQGWDQNAYSDLETQCQPTPQCTRLGGLVVKPRKGDAVFWYNSRPEAWNASRKEQSKRGFGDKHLIWGSMHCGAEVVEGEKLFANLWFRTQAPGPSPMHDEF